MTQSRDLIVEPLIERKYAINTRILHQKMSLFLARLGDEDLNPYERGLCSGYSFMNFRAELLGEEDFNVARMRKISEKSDKALCALADAYKEYKAHRSLIIKTEVNYLDKQIQSLKHVTESKELSHSYRDFLQKKMSVLQKNRQQIIKTCLQQKFTPKKLKRIQKAKQLYIYIHHLTAAHAPYDIDYMDNDKLVEQSEFDKILQLLPADKWLSEQKEIKLPVKEVFSIAFNFTQNELIDLFSNKLAKNTLCENDCIKLSSHNHAIYVSYKNGQFTLYDPDPMKLTLNTSENLVALLKKRFFANHRQQKWMMPLGIRIFSENPQEAQIVRPDRRVILKPIIDHRGENKLLDTQLWDAASALMMAVKYGFQDIVAMLIEAKADVNKAMANGFTPIHVAACYGQVEAVQLLINAKAAVNKRIKGWTAINRAAKNGSLSIVQMLIEAKADVNQSLVDGSAPIHSAILRGDVAMVRSLINAQANVNKKYDFCSPVSMAIKSGSTSIARMLVEAKADIHAFEVYSPLYCAIRKSNFAMIKILLDHGAKTALRDAMGATPISYNYTANSKAFVMLQMLKKILQTYDWEGQRPEIASKQLKRIHEAEVKETQNWSEVLSDVIALAQTKSRRSACEFFSCKSLPETLYRRWFALPMDELYEKLSQVLAQHSASAAVRASYLS